MKGRGIMKLKKLLAIALIVSILSIGFSITAFAEVDTLPWSIGNEAF